MTALARPPHYAAAVETAETGARSDGGAALLASKAEEMRPLFEAHVQAARYEAAAVREELVSARGEYARELAVVRRELSRLSSDHARVSSELSDLRYYNARLCALLEPSGAINEVGMVCRWYGSGPDAYREYRSVMSVLFNVHAYDLSEGFMRFFTTKEACELRLVHGEFRDAVAATPWHDTHSTIKGCLRAWSACFPKAQAASVFRRADLVDADFVRFRGLRALNMTSCSRVSDAAFVNLRGIDSLVMIGCEQPGITARAFTHLKGIQELDMVGCNAAITAAASHLLRGARSLIFPSLADNQIFVAVRAADVPQCRRLLAARALGSACWLYAGVTFHELPAPASAHGVIATACMELLRVALDAGSDGMLIEAVGCIINASQTDASRAACIAAGAVPALVATLDWHGRDTLVCGNVCGALGNLAFSAAGRAACGAAGAMRPIVSVLRLFEDDAQVLQNAFAAVSMLSWSSPSNVATFVSLGAAPSIVAAFRKSDAATSLCLSFALALRPIAAFPCGVEACLAAGAVPLLAAAYAKDEDSREHSKAALKLLGHRNNLPGEAT